MRWKGILFDLDGTLIDSLPDIVQSVNNLRRGRGLGTLTRGFCLPHIGKGADYLIRGVLPQITDSTEILRAVAEYQQSYLELPSRSKPFAGVIKGLSELKVIFPELRFAVVTNKSTRLAIKTCEEHLSSLSFEVIQGPEKLKARKPAKEHADAVLGVMKLDADEVVICGDDLVDYELAKNIGTSFFAANWGYGKLKLQVSYSSDFNPCSDFTDFCQKFISKNL